MAKWPKALRVLKRNCCPYKEQRTLVFGSTLDFRPAMDSLPSQESASEEEFKM